MVAEGAADKIGAGIRREGNDAGNQHQEPAVLHHLKAHHRRQEERHHDGAERRDADLGKLQRRMGRKQLHSQRGEIGQKQQHRQAVGTSQEAPDGDCGRHDRGIDEQAQMPYQARDAHQLPHGHDADGRKQNRRCKLRKHQQHNEKDRQRHRRRDDPLFHYFTPPNLRER